MDKLWGLLALTAIFGAMFTALDIFNKIDWAVIGQYPAIDNLVLTIVLIASIFSVLYYIIGKLR